LSFLLEHTPVEITTLLKTINETHKSTVFSLLKRYTDGEQGAYSLLEQQTGQRFVLKWHANARTLSQLQHIATIVAQLSVRGYPAPIYHIQGEFSQSIYTIQEALPGSPLYQLSSRFLPRLLELNAMQRQIGSRDNDWPREIVETVLVGGQGYCQHESLLNHSLESKNLLFEIQRLVSQNKHAIKPANDIVHFDFQPYNILVQEQEVTGIIDWDGCCSGDCMFDLVTLFFYAYDDSIVRKQLWLYILGHTSIRTAAVYLAHLLLRQVDWSLRHHQATEGELYLHRAQAILNDLASYEELPN
jgi:hypothetical protein